MRFWPRFRNGRREAPIRVVLATRHARTLAWAWRRDDLVIEEVVSTTGLLAALNRAHLIVLRPDDLEAPSLSVDAALKAVEDAGVPCVAPDVFLADPDRFLAEARAFRGEVKALPPRLVAFTSLDSGGVGKTTLTLNLALAFARHTRLSVAVVELTRAASGFLPILAARGAEGAFPTAYDLLTRGESPGVWRRGDGQITVVPMEGRNVHLMSVETFGDLLDRVAADHVLTVVDVAQPHALWPAVRERADRIFVVAAAGRPETVANAHTLAAELGTGARLVLNMATAVDRVAAAGEAYIPVPRSRRVAALRGEKEVRPLLQAVWPYYPNRR